jgi:hypothetical protein
LREFDDNRRISVTEDTLHCEEPSLVVDRRDDEDSGGLGYILVSEPGRPT